MRLTIKTKSCNKNNLFLLIISDRFIVIDINICVSISLNTYSKIFMWVLIALNSYLESQIKLFTVKVVHFIDRSFLWRNSILSDQYFSILYKLFEWQTNWNNIMREKSRTKFFIKSNRNYLTKVWLKYFYNRKTKTKFSKKELKFEF
jgi:hypothetical protein